MRIVRESVQPMGHTLVELVLNDIDGMKRAIVGVLEEVWLDEILDDNDIDEYRAALMEFGIDLEQAHRTRGLSNTGRKTKYDLIKDRGDVGEVIGYLREKQIRGIPQNDLHLPLLRSKLKGRLTTHGVDGIGFIWSTDDNPDQMVLCEWKHTSHEVTLTNPCTRAAEEWVDLSTERLLQELKLVRRTYRDRAMPDKWQRIKWFALDWLNHSPNVHMVTLIVHGESVDSERARRDIAHHLIERIRDDDANPRQPEEHEANLVPIPNMVDFLDSCTTEFTDARE